MISFVVIAYNEERHIRRCIESIEAQVDLGDYEIIVIDDGSMDTTAEIVRDMQAEMPALRLVEQENRGRGAARAAGVHASTGDLVAMVDADICLPPEWLTICLQSLGEYDAVGGDGSPGR